MSWITKIKDPMPMQGTLDRSGFFEGWYYRMIAPTGECLSLIPGYSTALQDPHCFLQFIITGSSTPVPAAKKGQNTLRTGYLPYPIQEFHSQKDPFLLKISENRFHREGMDIQLKSPELNLSGNLSFRDLTPIRTSLFSPNIMGLFAYIPKMECYHGVISMAHQLEGRVAIDGKAIDFTGGIGYLEKDWGTSFPKEYVWIQCNQFQSGKVSLMCSIADIPFLGTQFQGHIINFVMGDREYRFATYNHSKISFLQVQNKEILILVDHPHRSLQIHATLDQEGELRAPHSGQMKRIIKEGLQGTVTIQLRDKRTGTIVRDEGIRAGI